MIHRQLELLHDKAYYSQSYEKHQEHSEKLLVLLFRLNQKLITLTSILKQSVYTTVQFQLCSS